MDLTGHYGWWMSPLWTLIYPGKKTEVQAYSDFLELTLSFWVTVSSLELGYLIAILLAAPELIGSFLN